MDYLKKDLKIIKICLLIIASVVILFVLRLFSFIFIPLFLALFIALLLLPILDWFKYKKIPNWLGVVIIIVVSVMFMWLIIKVAQNTSIEVLQSKDEIIASANEKINPILLDLQRFLGKEPEFEVDKSIIDFNTLVENNSVKLFNQVSTFIVGLFMTIFFLAIFLTGAHLFEDFLNNVTDRHKDSIQVFREIKSSLNGFIKVKFFTSVFTGVGFALVAMFFGVKFALFWGFIAFLLNFVQLIGSIFITAVLLIFGFVEIQSMGTFLLFGGLLVGVQVLFGGVLEPIFMGKSFHINTIAVLLSLAIWGFVFGIAGLVLAIPITVFLKIILDRIPATKPLSRLLSRNMAKKKWEWV